MKEISLKELEEAASLFGLTLLAHLDIQDAQFAMRSDVEALRDWQKAGFAADMEYMKRDASLFSDFQHFLPDCRSLLCFAVSYYWRDEAAETVKSPLKTGFGRVARYAWGRDYHRVLKKRLRKLLQYLEQTGRYSPLSSRVFTDSVPLLERAIAKNAKLGFIGKNSLLIRPGVGSFTLLGEILWNLKVQDTSSNSLTVAQSASCKTCSRCMDSCPTEAIVAERKVDASKCISYLTIEKRGAFNSWQQQALGEWVFGCDICQEVCPFNHESVLSPHLEEFSASSGVGPLLDLGDCLSIREDQEFLVRFQGTPLMRAGRLGLLRNAAAVVANTNAVNCLDALLQMGEVDSSDMLRDAARHSILALLPHTEGAERRRIHAFLGRKSE